VAETANANRVATLAAALVGLSPEDRARLAALLVGGRGEEARRFPSA
jgi:hypothetical protein